MKTKIYLTFIIGVVLTGLLFQSLQAQTISTIAGNGVIGFCCDDSVATKAIIHLQTHIAMDNSGNLYICDIYNFRIRKVSTSGIMTTFAGNGIQGYNGDGGPATAAETNYPDEVAVDGSGNVYFSDQNDGVIRKVDLSGNISTFAGCYTCGGGYSGDGGPATAAEMNVPQDLSFDGAGNLYVADCYNHCIRKINTSGIISTVAGIGTVSGYSGDGGPATAAELFWPGSVHADASGVLFIADTYNNAIRKVDLSGNISTVAGDGYLAGTGNGGFYGDGGPATAAELNQPYDAYSDPSGNIYISDAANWRVRMVNTSGNISTFAGNGTNLYTGDGGPATAAGVYAPWGVTTDASGNVYISDNGNNVIRMVNNSGTISTYAGQYDIGFSGDHGPATAAQIYYPSAVATDPSSGDLYIADFQNNRVRKVAYIGGNITSFAGNGYGAPSTGGFSGDGGQATDAELWNPAGVATDASGNVYISDFTNSCVRMVNTSGVITTFAGKAGSSGYWGDGGPATAAWLYNPRGLAVDKNSNVYIADANNNVIRMVNTSGVISTIAGNNLAGYSGDGGAATAAELQYPAGVAVDGSGNIYVADENNNVIRGINTSGIIATIAGDGVPGFWGDGGPATAAEFNRPSGVAVDVIGEIFVADQSNSCIRYIPFASMKPDHHKITLSVGNVSTVAGQGGNPGFSGDGGPATAAQFNLPIGVAIDKYGNFYVADRNNNRVRELPSIATSVNSSGGSITGKVTIYPNPNNGKFTLQATAGNDELKVEVYNIFGEKVYLTTLTKASNGIVSSFDLGNEASGVYFYRVVSESNALVGEGKIMIEK